MEEFLGRDIGGRPALVRRGLAALICLGLLGAFTTAYTKGTFSDAIQVHAMVDDAGGSLTPGADVKSRGVIVGRTTGISLSGSGVDISMTLGKGGVKRLPSNVVARVLPATVFGTSYVDLVLPEHPDASSLRAGQTIAQDRSTKTLELQTALDSLYRVVTAVSPAQLATTLASVSQALNGRGEEIGDSLQLLDTYLIRANPHIPLLREDLRLLADNLETLDRHAPELFDAVDDGLVTVRTITAKRAELTTLLSGGAALVAEADRLLTDEEQPFVDTIRQAAVLTDAFYDNREQIAPGFRAFVRFGKRGSTALADGPWLTTDVRIETTGGTQYTAADCPKYGSIQGDNCAGGATSASLASTVPDIDSDLIKQLQQKLAQFDGPAGGIGELLANPLVGNSSGGAR